jgi:hypothetical protein
MSFVGFLNVSKQIPKPCLQTRHYRLLPQQVPAALPQKEEISGVMLTRGIPQPFCMFGEEKFFDTPAGSRILSIM